MGVTRAEWIAQGTALFGDDMWKWRFVCPSCGHVQTPEDFRGTAAPTPDIAYLHCIGGYDGKHGRVDIGTKPGPCNYSSGGLFNLNPVEVVRDDGRPLRVFAFAAREGDHHGEVET